MPTAEIEEFAAKLVETVRDRAIQAGDALLLPQFTSGRARRRRQSALGASLPDPALHGLISPPRSR